MRPYRRAIIPSQLPHRRAVIPSQQPDRSPWAVKSSFHCTHRTASQHLPLTIIWHNVLQPTVIHTRTHKFFYNNIDDVITWRKREVWSAHGVSNRSHPLMAFEITSGRSTHTSLDVKTQHRYRTSFCLIDPVSMTLTVCSNLTAFLLTTNSHRASKS